MKKLLIAFSLIGAVALVSRAAENVPQSNSVTTNYAYYAWFSASAEDAQINSVGGSFSTKAGSEATFEAKDSKIEIDSEIEDPVSFVLDETNVRTTDLAKVTFELDAAFVQESSLPGASKLDGVKTAFALVANDEKATTNFQAWVKKGDVFDWQELSFANVPDAGESYNLTMRIDDSAEVKKIQFAVRIAGQENEEVSAWYVYGGLAEKPQVDFVGCGKIKELNADQVAIVSAEIDFSGGKVTIAEKDADAMGKLVPSGKTIEETLALPVKETFKGGAITISDSCTLSTAEAYAIGLIANENGTMVAKADGTFKVKAEAQADVSDGIPVGFVTPLTPNDTTATFGYQLQGSADGTAGYVNVGDLVHPPATIVIPTDKVGVGEGKYRYFKVVTTVTLRDAPAPEKE